MKSSMETRLRQMTARHEEIAVLLADPTVTEDLNRYRDLSREYAQLEPQVQTWAQYQAQQLALAEAKLWLEDEDPELQLLAKNEIQLLEERLLVLTQSLQAALIPRDPLDDSNIFLEVRAGTGGDEAAIFAGDLSRMYMRYAEAQGFQSEILSESHGEHGGYKEIIVRVTGDAVYARFKFESGVHRVQRVPATEAQGRIHTSTCTVAILPEFAEIETIDINPADLRTDTFRSSGAGGQHVQKTDSAIRITHIPTGIVVECQDERSQHKNRARAMSLLKSRILAAERERQHQQQADTRRSLVGTGDRSERIRTYNFPQGRLTDHRINLTLYQLPQIMEGELDDVIQALGQEYQADLMASLGE